MTATTAPIRQLSVIEAHALWAESYDRTPNPLLALEERIVAPLLPALQEMQGMLTVDVACGTGRWLANLLGRGARFGVGLDLSPAMLKHAQCKPSLHDRFVLADCAAMPFRGDAADVAMCSFAVSYLPDIQRFAGELARIVRQGGQVFLSDFHPAAHLRGWTRTFRHNQAVIEVASFRYSITEICRVFATAGFDLVTRIEPCFGEAEREIFNAHGKGHLVEQLSREPAIFVCHFRRTETGYRGDNAKPSR